MATRAVKYVVIDAFTDTPFKGNPAAVCILEDEVVGAVDEKWMQSVAKEFNISQTTFLGRATCSVDSDSNGVPNNPRFNLRWFTPVAEVKLCGHGTLAAAHYLLTFGVVKCDVIEFVTKSGLLTAKKVRLPTKLSNNEAEGRFYIELDFPMVPVVECDSTEIPSIPETLNGAAVVNVQKIATANDLIVELASGNEVAGIHPKFGELQNCAGRGVIITGAAPSQSGFDFFTRFFCPKLGVNEDPVCGSAHCALAPYWSKKLGKNNLIAYMASPRGGILDLQWEEETLRVKIRGEAATVMIMKLRSAIQNVGSANITKPKVKAMCLNRQQGDVVLFKEAPVEIHIKYEKLRTTIFSDGGEEPVPAGLGKCEDERGDRIRTKIHRTIRYGAYHIVSGDNRYSIYLLFGISSYHPIPRSNLASECSLKSVALMLADAVAMVTPGSKERLVCVCRHSVTCMRDPVSQCPQELGTATSKNLCFSTSIYVCICVSALL